MKGVRYITDEKNRRQSVIIELKTIAEQPDAVEDLLDLLIAESRKGEPKRSWDAVKKDLHKKGKL